MLYNYIKQEWYTPAEVAVHNKPHNVWVSLNGKVYDMAGWLEQQLKLCKCTKACTCERTNWYCGEDCIEICPCFKRGFPFCDFKREAVTIMAYAGKDVSHWFKGDQLIHHMHPVVTSFSPYYRYGPGPRRAVVPSTRWRPIGTPWWMNEKLIVGNVTAKTRPIRIVNTMTSNTVTLEVCSEETLYQIMMRYLPHNAHVLSYTWRYQGKPVCMNKTLEENGIPDEREIYDELGLPDNFYIPAILVYYNDDLTEDPPMPHDLWIEPCSCNPKDKECTLRMPAVAVPKPAN